MKIAVLTVTRDRLAYTQYCFGTLKRYAGCQFDHYVLDNGSQDGTAEWLAGWYRPHTLRTIDENIGLCPALNRLLDAAEPERYDVIVRFDNDCQVSQPDTLKTVCEVAYEYEAIIAPKVRHLNHPPPTVAVAQAGDHIVEQTEILGGIFMAIPATLFSEHGYRYDETFPPYTGDEAICPWWRSRGGVCGYLAGFSVNHYERVREQHALFPEYQARKEQEIAA